MSAAARAEARRKAILSRGSDRLAKLTTSARGENAPAYMHDDPPLPNLSTGLKSFVGEETSMPTPPIRMSVSPSPTPTPRSIRVPSAPAAASSTNEDSQHPGVAPPTPGRRSETNPDPTVWSPEQQRAFMQAIMSGAALPQQGPDSLPGLSPVSGDDVDPTLPPMDNPFAAMLFPQQGMGAGMGMGNGAGKTVAQDMSPPTKLQRLMPFVHLVMMWCLLAYFVVWEEPRVYKERLFDGEFGVWRRWAELRTIGPIGITAHMLQVQIVPFFWAFTTLQILLHSLRIFSGFDAVSHPTLIVFALPHLPPTVSSIVMNTLKYLQMGSLFLDDLSGLVVGLGFIILFSGWLAA